MDAETVLSCGHKATPSQSTTGFGLDENGNTLCYACCAERDRKSMRETGQRVLYLTRETTSETLKTYRHYVTNWPGSLKIQVYYSKTGRHNMARKRTDVWFTFEGYVWHGTQYGSGSDLCYCKRTKKSA